MRSALCVRSYYYTNNTTYYCINTVNAINNFNAFHTINTNALDVCVPLAVNAPER